MGKQIGMFAALAIVAAILYNASIGKIQASSFAAKLQSGASPKAQYAGKTAVTAIAFMGVLFVAATLMGVVAGGGSKTLPSA